MFTKKILAAAITSQPTGDGVASAIDFDGVNDYLSRSSDLVGNTDGKTFTFSCWVWIDTYDTGGFCVFASYDATFRFRIYVNTNGSIRFEASNSAGTQILLASTSSIGVLQRYTWNHIVISIDLASTSNRSLYVNNDAVSVTYNTYTNAAIDFTQPNHAVANDSGSGDYNLKGRLAHLFLDYTYRDLSIEANRRLFITADRKPTPKATLQALNPILYLPLDDPTQAGKNLGTGGDFTLNGVVARSGRGPNQFNAAYSDLDGAADYLSRAANLTGVTDGQQLTIAYCASFDTLSGDSHIFSMDSSGVRLLVRQSSNFNIFAANAAGTTILNASVTSPVPVLGRNYHVAISIDLSNTAKRAVYINGQQATVTWSTYNTSGIFDFSLATPSISVGDYGGIPFNGRLGNVFFDTKYIDLSNPANLAKFVAGTGIDAKPVDLGVNGELPFGTPPLIYLPMYGNNAGKNYGTGGDFTVNSGPFAGARGPNEFWGNNAVFNGTNGRLSRISQLSSISDSKTLSLSFYLSKNASALYTLVGTTGSALRVTINASNQIVLTAKNSSGVTVLNATVTTTISNTTPTAVNICIDLNNSANRFVYLNGVAATVTWATYTNDLIDLTTSDFAIGSEIAGANYFAGYLSELYLTTQYIDFSQEANRLKFRDAFGNPVDLRPQIAAGTLPNPAIYMRFDPSNFGKNDGTGGDFVVNGTITDGGQL